MVRNTSTGQVVDTNHPIYTAALNAAPAPPTTGGGSPAPPGGIPAAPTTAGQALTAPATAGATVAPGAPTTAAGAFQQALVNRLTAPPVTAQSPELAGAIGANKLSQQRGFERDRSLLAERSAANGTSGSGGFDAQLLGLSQNRSAQEGQFAGNAVLQRSQQQANELTQALTLGGGLLSQQDQLAMQQRLAELNAQIQRESLAAQTSLGTQDLGLRRDLGQGNLNLGLLSALLQNQQFGQGLGLQAGIAGQQFNQNALLGLLGAL
jgi:hypothetical protein